MKLVNFHVQQKMEEFDPQALKAAVELGQSKVTPLGLNNFEAANLSFSIGPTEVMISMSDLPESDEDTVIE
jgi:hypothetical protein